MPTSRHRTIVSLLAGCALSVAPLAVATVVSPAPSWAACDPQPGPGAPVDCPPPPADAPPLALPQLPPLSPSDVAVNVYPGPDSGFTVSPPAIGWTWPQFCLPNIQTPIPFVGYQPCI